MDRTTYGLDIAKRVMQVYWVDHQTAEIGKRALKRSQLMLFFGRRPGARIVLEACGSGHYWARQLSRLGHEVRLIHAKRVRPFVRGNKNDAADAQAIWVAAQQPDVRSVPLKSEEQQAVLSLHRVRSQWIKVRTQMVNAMRGLLYEFGRTCATGSRSLVPSSMSMTPTEFTRFVRSEINEALRVVKAAGINPK